MSLRSLLATLLLLCAMTGERVHAAEPERRLDCENASSTVELNACADQDFAAADAVLNETYKKALAAIPEMATEAPFDAKGWEAALRASQRSWLAFRDAECDGHVPMFWGGGTGTSSDVSGCKTELTNARIKQLKDRYENN